MTNDTIQDKTFEYKGGAKRKATMPFYGGVPLAGLRRAAEAFDSGRYTYDENLLERNWHKGDAKFFLDTIDHAVEHLYKYLEEIQTGRIYDGDEDHLGHAIAELMMVAWATERQILPDKTVQFIPVNTTNIPVPSSNLTEDPQEGTKETFIYEGSYEIGSGGEIPKKVKVTEQNNISSEKSATNTSQKFLNTIFGKKG